MGLRLWPHERADELALTALAPPVGTATAAQAVSAEGPPSTAPRGLRVQPPPASPNASLPAQAPGPRSAPRAGADPRIGTLDWTTLREAVAACRACALCESRTQTVFGTGSTEAHWMVVGEAPGENEDLQGEPFVGPAGQLLDRMLAALLLTRATDGPAAPSQRVYITNTLKCRPPRNRNPGPDELQQCEPYLVRQVELLRPRLILAMGAFAVRSLLKTDAPVGRLRGRVHHFQGVPLIVTYHPAYLLRNPADKARAWEDLCLAVEVAERAASDAGGDAPGAPAAPDPSARLEAGRAP